MEISCQVGTVGKHPTMVAAPVVPRDPHRGDVVLVSLHIVIKKECEEENLYKVLFLHRCWTFFFNGIEHAVSKLWDHLSPIFLDLIETVICNEHIMIIQT